MLAGQIEHELLSEENACKMFQAATADFTPERYVLVEIDGEPKIVSRNDTSTVLMVECRLQANVAAWDSTYKRLFPLLQRVASRQSRGSTIGDGWTWSSPLASDKDNIVVILYRESGQDNSVSYFDGFELPWCLEPEIRGLAVRHSDYRLSVALLDTDDRIVAKTSGPLPCHLICKYNASYRVFSNSSLQPLLHKNWAFHHTMKHSAKLTVSLEDLRRVAKCATYIEKASDE
jgi:hypothetical protein